MHLLKKLKIHVEKIRPAKANAHPCGFTATPKHQHPRRVSAKYDIVLVPHLVTAIVCMCKQLTVAFPNPVIITLSLLAHRLLPVSWIISVQGETESAIVTLTTDKIFWAAKTICI